jgi:LPXTG-site transpeptidase (sortase) family protein
MFSARWMILAGIVLFIGGLANAVYDGVRQPPAPLDIPVESSGDDLGQGFAPLDVPDAQGQNAMAPTLIGESATATQTVGPATTLEAGPTATPTPVQGYTPDRIVIPAVGLDAPIIPAKTRLIKYFGKIYEQWVAPDEFAAGWHEGSALLGLPGNTVLNGHHNEYGEVFGGLVDLKEGDLIEVYSGTKLFVYQVRLKMILRELGEPIEVRYENARWIAPSADERLTLITCWPKTGNAHRLIIVAFPTSLDSLEEHQ